MTDRADINRHPLLHAIFIQEKDDWSGVSDPTQRRRIQNRLNRRALRSRQRRAQAASAQAVQQPVSDAVVGRSAFVSASSLINAILTEGVDLKSLLDRINMLDPDSPDNQTILRAFEMVAKHDKRVGVIRSGMVSNLHQFNFTRALMLNAEAMGLSAEYMDDDDACSLFVLAGPWPLSVKIDSKSLPEGLQPTSIQRRVEHHPWIDLLPIPKMRDNLLEKDPDSYDDGELCRAFSGRLSRQGSGMIVWREPWDATGWEVTEEFVKSWGWVIAGCTELFRSTNMWRHQRGQGPLFRLSN